MRLRRNQHTGAAHPKEVTVSCIECGEEFVTEGRRPRKTCGAACRNARVSRQTREDRARAMTRPTHELVAFDLQGGEYHDSWVSPDGARTTSPEPVPHPKWVHKENDQ